MKIFIISAVFSPEPITSAGTSADIADCLSRRGHEVTVFTSFPNRPDGTVKDGFRRQWRFIREMNGVRIVHCWHSLSRHSQLFSRFVENITFGITSSLQVLNAGVPDVVYMITWPIFAQNLNSLLLSWQKVPIVCSVVDIYPESLTGKGLLRKDGFIACKIMKWDKIHIRRCYKIVTLTDSMKELLVLQRDIPPEKVIVLPNWQHKTPFLKNYPKIGQFRKQHGINPEAFVAMFVGSLSMSAGIDLYIKVAELLRGRNDIRILLVGGGSMRKILEKRIMEKNLTNIQVIYPLMQENVPEVQAAADVLLLSLTGAMGMNAAPSKQIAYMLSGRPIVASIDQEGTLSQIIVDSNAGFVLPPDNPEVVANLLIKLANDPTPLQQLGENARKYAIANFSTSAVLPRLIDLIESTYSPRS